MDDPHCYYYYYFIYFLFLFLFFLYYLGLKGDPLFSKVSHHLGVYFLRFVELLHGESGVKVYLEDHVCVCV